jgi:hypothetical protein
MQQLKKPGQIDPEKATLKPTGQKIETPDVSGILQDLKSASVQEQKDAEFRRRSAQQKAKQQQEAERQRRKDRAAKQCGCW